jgi:hypothetical protein
LTPSAPKVDTSLRFASSRSNATIWWLSQPLDHVHAHFAETNESDFHQARLPLAYDDTIRICGRAAEDMETPPHASRLNIRCSI